MRRFDDTSYSHIEKPSEILIASSEPYQTLHIGSHVDLILKKSSVAESFELVPKINC